MNRAIVFALLLLGPILNSVAQIGKVGINTSAPAAMLHVKDSSVLFSSLYYENMPQYDAPPPFSGAGARMMWYPQRRSLRSGMVTGTQWNQSNTGLYSFATGYNPVANGDVSYAFGKDTIANGYASMVIGIYNTPIENNPQIIIEPTTPLFIIGNGDEQTRSNAFLVRKDGRVGIGTNTPSDLLHLNAASGDPLRVQVAGSTKLRVWNNGGTSIGTTQAPAINGLFVNGPIEPAGGIVSATRPIHIESTTDSIEIMAGGNRIVIFADGGIKISTSGGATNDISIDAGSNDLILKGSTITLDASNTLNLTSDAITNVVGSLVKFNGGSTPVAKLGSTVQVNTATGVGTVTGNGSPTVLVQ